MTVTVYTAGPACQACRLTTQKLDKQGVDYDERPLDEASELIDIHQLKTAPVVVARIGDAISDIWDGLRPDRIAALAS